VSHKFDVSQAISVEFSNLHAILKSGSALYRKCNTLVACPDNCLSEEGALIGLIGSAKRTLTVLQNSIPLWWGKKKGEWSGALVNCSRS
jgi:hypothetical protein